MNFVDEPVKVLWDLRLCLWWCLVKLRLKVNHQFGFIFLSFVKASVHRIWVKINVLGETLNVE